MTEGKLQKCAICEDYISVIISTTNSNSLRYDSKRCEHCGLRYCDSCYEKHHDICPCKEKELVA